MRRSISLGLILGVLFFCSSVRSAEIVAETGFDTGFEGWTINDSIGASWKPVGGNPGGYIVNTDSNTMVTLAIAPNTYLGDLSGLDDSGRIQFDMKLFSFPSNPSASFYHIKMLNESNRYVWTLNFTPELTDWSTITVPLIEDQWQFREGTWADLLSNVESIQIQLDTIAGSGEVVGLDNVRLILPSCSGKTSGFIPGDINKDCYVDFLDYALLASYWLQCNDPQNQSCNEL